MNIPRAYDIEKAMDAPINEWHKPGLLLKADNIANVKHKNAKLTKIIIIIFHYF